MHLMVDKQCWYQGQSKGQAKKGQCKGQAKQATAWGANLYVALNFRRNNWEHGAGKLGFPCVKEFLVTLSVI
jgi:hypothetical protein